MESRAKKIQFLKDVKAGKVRVEDNKTPFIQLDLDNLPCATFEDYAFLMNSYEYCRDNNNPAACEKIFEGIIAAGKCIGIVDTETEQTWRHMLARSKRMFIWPVKASLHFKLKNKHPELAI
jgi:hypothetical protein